MPIPSVIGDLSTTPASNYPAGTDSPGVLDDVQRVHASFIAQLRDGTGLASTALASPPAIGGTTPNAVTATTVNVVSGSLGYGTGAGGTTTQATNNFTGVTLHKPAGRIIMSGVSLPGNSTCYFTLTNSFISITDIVSIQQINNSADLLPHVVSSAAGSCTIVVRNLSATAYNTAIVLQFAVIKGVTS